METHKKNERRQELSNSAHFPYTSVPTLLVHWDGGSAQGEREDATSTEYCEEVEGGFATEGYV